MVKTGETVTVGKVTGKDDVRQHLAELGLVVGGGVTVVNEVKERIDLIMFSWLSADFPTLLAGAAVLALVSLSLRTILLRKGKRAGCSGCCAGCAKCTRRT